MTTRAYDDDFGPLPVIYGAVHSINDEKPDDAPVLWIPDPERPSQYVEHVVRPQRRPLGFR